MCYSDHFRSQKATKVNERKTKYLSTFHERSLKYSFARPRVVSEFF